ncbi:unnamed protein product [Linum trigynum]|uniref:Uncharacterized protein n=1 Tax=Linum trigynum TaxID=586398 RepID=A0AAV2FDU1_9ROSI
MGRICSGMMISTPMTISKLDLMKPSSKIASTMCSSSFLSLGLCFCSKSLILLLVARNWLKNQDFPTHTGRPHGRVAHPVARVSQNAAYQLVRSSGFPHGQGRTAVWDFHHARVCSRRNSHGHLAPPHVCPCGLLVGLPRARSSSNRPQTRSQPSIHVLGPEISQTSTT